MLNDQKPEPKQFSLTVHEANLLRFVQSHQAAIFSGVLSTIAGSRLGYTVTPDTQFQLSGDMATMTLVELEAPDAPKADSGSPAVTAPENKTEGSDEEAQTKTNGSVASGLKQDDNADVPTVHAEKAVDSDKSDSDGQSGEATSEASQPTEPAAKLEPTAEQLEAEESLNEEIAEQNKADGFNADGSKIDVPEPQPVTPAS